MARFPALARVLRRGYARPERALTRPCAAGNEASSHGGRDTMNKHWRTGAKRLAVSVPAVVALALLLGVSAGVARRDRTARAQAGGTLIFAANARRRTTSPRRRPSSRSHRFRRASPEHCSRSTTARPTTLLSRSCSRILPRSGSRSASRLSTRARS